MNKHTVKYIAVGLCAALCAGCIGTTVYAISSDKKEVPQTDALISSSTETTEKISKDETVYVLAGADGSVNKIIVSDWIKNTLGSATVSDQSELSDIENVKGNESYTMNGNTMKIWDAQGNDIYYQGNIEKELPVGLSVSYKLDGKAVSPSDLAGKSGKVTIRFDYENHQYETVSIDGKEEKIYVPFAMLTGMLLDTDTFRNVEITNGKLINDGNRMAVIGIAFPGLQENIGLDKETLEIPSYVEITADAENFSTGITITLATNELFNKINSEELRSAEDLTSSLGELSTAMQQLIDGSSSLYNGLETLLDKSSELVNGINQLAAGAKELQNGAKDLDSGAAKLQAGAAELHSGLSQLSAYNDTLNGGAKQIFDTLLSTANTQLATAGITVPKLTIDNYTTVLNDLILSLDETAVYNQALQTVTDTVETNRPMIAEKVTETVKMQVANQVISAATKGQMTKESYEAAVAAGQIDAVTQEAVKTAIASQMESEAVQNTIAENIDFQIKQAISENMASNSVQNKLQTASEGAAAVITLKASLDSYNSFYLGLHTYTDSVTSAASGAAALDTGATALKEGTETLQTGVNALCNGIMQIKNGAPALIDGITRLKDGTLQLSDGLKQLNEEGIQKLVSAADEDLDGIITRVKATADVSKNYKNFSGLGENMTGQVKFIYRTDSINADTEN